MNINPSFSQTLQQQIDALPHAQKERLAFIDFSLQYFGHISRTELIARFRTGLALPLDDFAHFCLYQLCAYYWLSDSPHAFSRWAGAHTTIRH